MPVLTSFPAGTAVKILSLPQDDFLQKRLTGMGLFPGAGAKIFCRAGGNTVIDVSGIRLALSNALAGTVGAAREEDCGAPFRPNPVCGRAPGNFARKTQERKLLPDKSTSPK